MQLISVTSQKTSSIVSLHEVYEFAPDRDQQDFVVNYHDDAVESMLVAYAVPITEADVEEWLKFQCLVVQWGVERGAMSSITEAAMCPAYQSIIGMGPSAVPLILAELRLEGDEPDQWFWALKAITGADPVSDEDRGDFVAMARAWFEWAEENRVW